MGVLRLPANQALLALPVDAGGLVKPQADCQALLRTSPAQWVHLMGR